MFLHSFSCLSHYFSFNFYQHALKSAVFRGKCISRDAQVDFTHRN